MKKIIAVILASVCILGVCGCNNNISDSIAEHEAVVADYGKVNELAKAEFTEMFKEFENIQIEQISTMTRTADNTEIVVQFEYSSNSGNGVYDFLYNLDDYANPELMKHGKEITVDYLLE